MQQNKTLGPGSHPARTQQCFPESAPTTRPMYHSQYAKQICANHRGGMTDQLGTMCSSNPTMFEHETARGRDSPLPWPGLLVSCAYSNTTAHTATSSSTAQAAWLFASSASGGPRLRDAETCGSEPERLQVGPLTTTTARTRSHSAPSESM